MEIITQPRNEFSEKTDLVRQVVNHLGADYWPSHVVLDGDDYSNDPAVLDEFRDIAFSWTRDRPSNRVPPHVHSVMVQTECTHLIWLSRKAIEYDRIIFIWIVAHELRHIYQSRCSYPRNCIRSSVKELRRTQEFSNIPSSTLSPQEIDSDICSMRVAAELLGAEQLAQFLGSTKLPRCPFPLYPRLLEQVKEKCLTGDHHGNAAG